MATVDERFWSKVDIGEGDGCWLWTGAKSSNIRHGHQYGPYGKFYVGGGGRANPKYALAHRWAYEYVHGELPADIQVDHRYHCNTLCVNPAHLRRADSSQNGQNRNGLDRNNVSGVRGVNLYTNRSGNTRWRAFVGLNGKQVHIGYFDTQEQAEKAVLDARLELFTHNEQDKRKVGAT